MISSQQFTDAMALIARSEHILITTHTKPDGDACGSLVVMRDALLAQGKKVDVLLLSRVPDWYSFLATDPLLFLHEDVAVEDLGSKAFANIDLIILVDVNSESQLPYFCDFLKKVDVPILVLDHHASSDGLGTLELVDHSAAATGLLVYEFLQFTDWPITPSMAEGLFVAAATDTGWFQFSNTDSRVYRDCAALIDAGAQPKKIYDLLFQRFSVPRFQLMLAMLNKMELHFHDQFALQMLRQVDFERVGATSEDTENLINESHRIGSVKASTLLVELADGRIRCSLRSRDTLDVSAIANRYGGGGHKKASGTFLPGPLEHARELMLREFAAVFES